MENNTRYKTLFLFALLSSALYLQAEVYEAENAFLYHAVTETKNTGFIGDSYVNFNNEIGSYIEFTVSMADAGDQTVSFRYANGGTGSRPMSVSLDGTPSGQSLNFNLTGTFTSWTTESIVLSLKKGINLLRLTSSVAEGGPNLDNVDISGTAGQLFNVIINASGPGQVNVTPSGTGFYEGQVLKLTAVADVYGEFFSWTGDITGIDSPVEITVTGNLNITAIFNEVNVELSEPDFAMTGFATVSGDGYITTTGGTGGSVTVVSSLAELSDFASSRENETAPGILYIRGKIMSPTTEVVTIKHGANITILGEGEFGELENVGLNIRDYKNVIIRNLKIHEVFYPNDAITIDECQHVWVDHNELYSKIGEGIGVDTYDGLLDIKNGSKYVTASWNKIHHHMKTSLIGHTDNAAQEVIDSQFRITYHHNYFHDTDGRNPSIRWGAIHLYNNYFENISDYGIAVRQGAHAKLENNHYHSVYVPITTNKFDGEGYVCESGTLYSGTCSEANNSITQIDCGFWNDLPYLYNLEPTNTVALMVDLYAGVGIINTGNGVDVNDAAITKPVIFPNPARERLHILLNGPTDIVLADLQGRVIRHEKSDMDNMTLDISELQPGIYLLKISNKRGNETLKFIKE